MPSDRTVQFETCDIPSPASIATLYAAFIDARRSPLVFWRSPEGDSCVAAGNAWSTGRISGSRWRTLFLEGANEARRKLADAPPTARAMFAIRFDPEADTRPEWAKFPPAEIVIPEFLSVESPAGRSTIVAGAPSERALLRDVALAAENSFDGSSSDQEPVAGELSGRVEWDEDAYVHAVREGLGRIARGDAGKIVLARRCAAQLDPVSMRTVLPALFARGANGFVYAQHPADDTAFFSVTPERLARIEGDTLHTFAIAGTAAVAPDDAETMRRKAALEMSAKDNREHAFVVDMILETIAPFSSMRRALRQDVRRFGSVMHLVTPIIAHTRASLPEAVAALHPTPAVCGSPRDHALQCIREIERIDRGLYAGVVGWFDAAGNGDAAVAIRSALLCDGRLLCYAGAGIVSGSDPLEESRETRAKMRTILNAFLREPST